MLRSRRAGYGGPLSPSHSPLADLRKQVADGLGGLDVPPDLLKPDRIGRVEYSEHAQKEVTNQILTSLAGDVSAEHRDEGALFARIAGGVANAVLTQ
jgi:hypothetical protein